jgi:hypothetical protein
MSKTIPLIKTAVPDIEAITYQQGEVNEYH